MRKIWLAICTILASCLLIVGCTTGSTGETSALSTPEAFKLSTKGVLSWDEVDKATSYEVVIGDETVTTDTNKQDLTELITEVGSYTVSVKAKSETNSSKTGTYTLTAEKLPTPSKPVIESDPDTHMVQFVWTGGENTRGYLQKVNDGKWVSNTESFYAITSTGSYTISVKAKAYAASMVAILNQKTAADMRYTKGEA